MNCYLSLVGPILVWLVMHGNEEKGTLVSADPSEVTCVSKLTKNCGGMSFISVRKSNTETDDIHIHVSCQNMQQMLRSYKHFI